MSHVIKSFCTINTMHDGTMGNTAPLGELSPYARSFSTSKTVIADPAFENVSITVFSCQEANVNADLPAGVDTHLLSLMESVVEFFLLPISFEDHMASRHTDVTLVDVGALVHYNGRDLPGYFTYEVIIHGEPIVSTIWLSDSVFRDTYDEFEIRVVPPIPNVANLLDDYDTVLNLITAYGVTEQIAAQEAARNGDSATHVSTLTMSWVEPGTGRALDVTWVLVIFGPHGMLYENIIEAIRQYLLTHTGVPLDDWAEVFPDLIINITLTFIPFWDNVALASSGSLTYVHSPVFSRTDIENALLKRFDASAAALVGERALALTIGYKSLSMLSFPDNANGTSYTFRDVYGDYAIIPINDININRIAAATRDAIAAIEAAIRLAEVDNGTQVLPSGMTRESINGHSYLVYVVDGVKHKVLVKS